MAYTNIDDPSAYFQVKLWTGTGAAGNTITLDGNSDMQPDFMWHKEPTDTNGWHQMDSSRGPTYVLASQSDGAEYDVLNSYISSFNSNGFTAGYGDSSINSAGVSQCSWMWHCNGGTTSSNTDGTVTSTVQVNQDAGFSIVTWTTGVGSGNHSVGHGLGVKPAMFITKSRGGTSSWWTWHQGLAGDTSYVNLQATTAEQTFSDIWGDGITSSVFGYNYPATVYANQPYIAYCFAEKQGYSKFGKYVGNGNANGPFVYTGFKPAFVIVKQTNNPRNWAILDSTRSNSNPITKYLYTDLNIAELTVTSANYVDFLSNGFKVRATGHTTNESGGSYIYMAFAENPFVTSTGIPTTAR